MDTKALKAKKKQANSFIKKTFKILSYSKFSEIISWSPDGLSFVINNQHRFTSEILPQYFKHKNFSSFNRQLNMYDFHKTRENALEFTHPLFQKNNEKLLKKIRRKNPEACFSKGGTEELGLRLKRFQTQQNNMEYILQGLESQYDKIMEQNQILISELMQSKQREKRIESYIKKIEERVRKDKTREVHVQEEEPEDVLDLSSLSSND